MKSGCVDEASIIATKAALRGIWHNRKESMLHKSTKKIINPKKGIIWTFLVHVYYLLQDQSAPEDSVFLIWI